ncbi:hypothetical protein ACLESO_52530 [Pyxidicoccus sp. 3LG]
MMSQSGDSHRCPSIGLRSVTLAMLAVFSIQLGCSRAPTASPLTEAREAVASHILSRDVEPARTVAGHMERFGRLSVALGDEVPRTMSFFLRQALVRGTQDAVLEVFDQETGARTVYVLNDETGDAWVHTEDSTLHMVFNADKTILVGDTLAANENEAAQILLETGALDNVSQYSLFTMIDVVSQYLPEGQTARSSGGAVVLAAVAIWYVGSTTACSIELKKRNCDRHALSTYCRNWCVQRICWC